MDYKRKRGGAQRPAFRRERRREKKKRYHAMPRRSISVAASAMGRRKEKKARKKGDAFLDDPAAHALLFVGERGEEKRGEADRLAPYVVREGEPKRINWGEGEEVAFQSKAEGGKGEGRCSRSKTPIS